MTELFTPEAVAALFQVVMIDLVYNRADIDASPIVWARYMGAAQDRELIDYYPGRKFWILEADASPMQLRPYAGE